MIPNLSKFRNNYVICPETGCWLWTGYINAGSGYGRFSLNGKSREAYRIAYECFANTIPDDLELDHLCRVRNCVNPDHLEAVTHAENIRRGETGKWQSDKTHCPHGHEYTGDNLVNEKNGGRKCRTCLRARYSKYLSGWERQRIRARNERPLDAGGHPSPRES